MYLPIYRQITKFTMESSGSIYCLSNMFFVATKQTNVKISVFGAVLGAENVQSLTCVAHIRPAPQFQSDLTATAIAPLATTALLLDGPVSLDAGPCVVSVHAYYVAGRTDLPSHVNWENVYIYIREGA